MKRRFSDSLGLPDTESTAEGALEILANLLLEHANISDTDATTRSSLSAAPSFLDDRVCVPRHMGNLSSAAGRETSKYFALHRETYRC